MEHNVLNKNILLLALTALTTDKMLSMEAKRPISKITNDNEATNEAEVRPLKIQKIDEREVEPQGPLNLPINITLENLLYLLAQAKSYPVKQTDEEELPEASKSMASLSGLPQEIQLQIFKDYLSSPQWRGAAAIKSVYDIDKLIKRRSLAHVCKMFRSLILDPELKFLLIKQFVQENPEQAINDLVQAAFISDVDMVQNLIKSGVDVNCFGICAIGQDPDEESLSTPLEAAVNFIDIIDDSTEVDNRPNVKIVKSLLEAGAKPNLIYNHKAPTPLLDICKNDQLFEKTRDKIILMLLKAGANPDATDYDEDQPGIFYCIIRSSYTSIKYLLDYGANPFHYSCNHRVEKLCDLISRSEDKIKQIITNHTYGQLLFNCLLTKNFTALLHLIEQHIFKLPNFNINVQNSNGYTALMVAVDNNFRENAKYLLKHNANPNIKTNDGKTALSIAEDKTINTKAEMIDLLRKYGAQ